MWITFKQIGSRPKRQGGGSYTNLSVNNQIASVCPFFIQDNLPLTNSILRTLQNNPLLIARSATPVRNYIEKQYLDEDYVAGLIESWVKANLTSDSTVFIPRVNSTLGANYAVAAATSIVNSNALIIGRTFAHNAAILLAPLATQIFSSPSFISTIVSDMFDQTSQELRILENYTFWVYFFINAIDLIDEALLEPYVKDIAFPEFSFQIAVRYIPQVSPQQIYDSTSTLVATINSPECTYNGFLLYSYNKLLYTMPLKYVFNVYVETAPDYTTYMGCNVSGPVTLPLPYTITNSYNGGNPIMVAKFKPNGNTQWIANIFSTGFTTELINGIATDSMSNVYVYGSHPCINTLYCTDKNGCVYLNPIDNTPPFDGNGLPNESNAFIVKYDPDGNVLGFATIKGVYTQTINSVFVDPVTDIVYIGGGSTSLQLPAVVTGFNNETFSIPQTGRAFTISINNVGKSNVDPPLYGILASGIVTNGAFIQQDVPGFAEVIQVESTTKTSFVFSVFRSNFNTTAIFELNSLSNYRLYNESNPTPYLRAPQLYIVCHNALTFQIEFVTRVFFGSYDLYLRDNSTHFLCFTEKITEQFYFNFKSQGNAEIYSDNQTYGNIFLPPGVTKAEIIVRGLAVQYGFIYETIFISDSTINNMFLDHDMLYVSFSYNGICTIHISHNVTFYLKLTFGTSGTSGNALVRFDKGLNPNDFTSQILNPTLISNYTA